MERELKFRLDPADGASLLHSPALAAAKPDRRRMLATYVDTPDGTLAAARMGLRLRREGGRWRQTLKAGGTTGAGLHERPEWDFPAAPNRLDLARFAQSPLSGLDGAHTLHERLVATFSVDMARTRWRLAGPAGSRLEVALDEGGVRAGDREERFHELEIECLEGPADAAFDLAERLLESACLLPTTVTKAERGTRLHRGVPWTPSKAIAPALARAASVEEGARAVVGAALAHWHANQEGLLASDDPEFVHQSRIALRRLRSALRGFEGVVGEPRARSWRGTLGAAARGLGEARDWDVFATEVLPEALARWRTAGGEGALPFAQAFLDERRRAAREAARKAVASRDFCGVLLALARWGAEPAAGAGDGLRAHAAALIRKRHKRLMRDSEHLGDMTVEERHRVRIDAKRLRYCADALASLFDEAAAEAYVGQLSALQDALGEANDAVTGLRLMDGLDAQPGFDAFARGWLAARAAPAASHLALLRQRLADAPKFWKGTRD